jgi:hypothetical protein
MSFNCKRSGRKKATGCHLYSGMLIISLNNLYWYFEYIHKDNFYMYKNELWEGILRRYLGT